MTFSGYRISLYLLLLSYSVLGAKGFSTSTSIRRNFFSKQDLMEYADGEGVILSLSTLGPGYRAIARVKGDENKILGYVEGFVRPSGNLLHLDKMEVFRPIVKQARNEREDFRGGGTILGVGLLMGYLCLLHGHENNCNRCEFLAIDDGEKLHNRLVRYYKNAGFRVVKYVGEDLSSIPDRLIWGGCGTLLEQDIPYMLSYWTELMKKAERKDKL